MPVSGERLALLGGQMACNDHTFSRDRVAYRQADAEAVGRTLMSGKWSMFTSEDVAIFEDLLALEVGASDAVLVNSCTSAIHAALLAVGIPDRPRIAMPAYTYIGTCTPVTSLGGESVFVDIDPSTLSMSADALEEALRLSGPIDGVIMAHLFGVVGDYEAIYGLCRSRGIPLIHDCAQLFGCGDVVRSLVQTGPCCFSFGESKVLRLGEGGAVATNSPAVANGVRMARHQGEAWLNSDASRSSVAPRSADDALNSLASVTPGMNFRPPAVIGTLGIARLPHVEAELAARSVRATELLSVVGHVKYLEAIPSEPSAWWTLPVLVREGFQRDVVFAALLAEGVPVGVHFPRLIPDHPLYSRSRSSDGLFPAARDFSSRHMVLPIYPALIDHEVELIKEALDKIDALSDSLGQPDTADAAHRFLDGSTLDELCQGIFYFLRESEAPTNGDLDEQH